MDRTLVISMLVLTGMGCSSQPRQAPARPETTPQTADVIYTGGKIYTVDDANPWAEALAIRSGALVFVGSAEGARPFAGENTEVVDLQGAFAMPGIHDAHLHFESAYMPEMNASRMFSFDSGAKSVAELGRALKEYAEASPSLKLIFADGLPLNLFPNNEPTNSWLNEVVSDRPVVIRAGTEHEALLNGKALEMEGITRDTPSPQFGAVVKDAKTGEPTGFLREKAVGLYAIKHYPPLPRDQHKRGLAAIISYLNSVGIVGGKQQHAKAPVATAFKDIEADGKLSLRVALAWTYRDVLESMPLPEQERLIAERQKFASELIEVDFVKIGIDGNPGTTAAVLEPYLESGKSGTPYYSLEELTALVDRFDRMGLGISVHAMGDASTRLLIDALEATKRKNGQLRGRSQLAHASLIHPQDLSRLEGVNLTSEFSPVLWFNNEMLLGYAGEIGEERLNRIWPMQSVKKAGGRVVVATDGPLFWSEPIQTLETVVTRQGPSGGAEPLAAHEALDLPDAIRAMTLDAAYLLKAEGKSGSLEAGKRADLIVLSRNPFEIPKEDISEVKVLRTVFDGKVVYEADTHPSSEEEIEKHHGVQLDLSGDSGHSGCEWHRARKSHR
jgi:predicted amidohydrolase YtcJ